MWENSKFWDLYVVIVLLAIAFALSHVRLNRVVEGLLSLNESVESMEQRIVELERVKE